MFAIEVGLNLVGYRAGVWYRRNVEEAKFRMGDEDCDSDTRGLAVKTAARIEAGNRRECWWSVL